MTEIKIESAFCIWDVEVFDCLNLAFQRLEVKWLTCLSIKQLRLDHDDAPDSPLQMLLQHQLLDLLSKDRNLMFQVVLERRVFLLVLILGLNEFGKMISVEVFQIESEDAVDSRVHIKIIYKCFRVYLIIGGIFNCVINCALY